MLHHSWLGYAAAALVIATSAACLVQLRALSSLSHAAQDRRTVAAATRRLLACAGIWQVSVALVLACGGSWSSAATLFVLGILTVVVALAGARGSASRAGSHTDASPHTDWVWTPAGLRRKVRPPLEVPGPVTAAHTRPRESHWR